MEHNQKPSSEVSPEPSTPESVVFPLPCIVCGKKLEPAFKGDEKENNQPLHGLCFIGQGSYGSEFDPLDSRLSLIVNVCDDCVEGKAAEGAVVLMKEDRPERPKATFAFYRPQEAL